MTLNNKILRHLSDAVVYRPIRCKRADAGDEGLRRLLLGPEYADVQGAEGGQRRSLLL